jgi:hypothetical protein
MYSLICKSVLTDNSEVWNVRVFDDETEVEFHAVNLEAASKLQQALAEYTDDFA